MKTIYIFYSLENAVLGGSEKYSAKQKREKI